MDLSNVIPHDSKTRILQQIQSVEQTTGTEIQIVIVDTIPPSQSYTPKRMATTLFNQWKLGSRQKNNGVLILAVLKERRIEVEVGKGLNDYMGKDWCTNTLQTTAIPNFRNQQYDVGLETTVSKVVQRLREVDSMLVKQSKPSMWLSGQGGPTLLGFVGAIFICGLIGADLLKSMYPLSISCPKCNADYTTWDYTAYNWEIIREPTDKRSGLRQKICVCQNCGHEEILTKTIKQYDGSTTDSDGVTTYYYNTDSSDSGGGSSDGGGGGADW